MGQGCAVSLSKLHSIRACRHIKWLPLGSPYEIDNVNHLEHSLLRAKKPVHHEAVENLQPCLEHAGVAQGRAIRALVANRHSVLHRCARQHGNGIRSQYVVVSFGAATWSQRISQCPMDVLAICHHGLLAGGFGRCKPTRIEDAQPKRDW